MSDILIASFVSVASAIVVSVIGFLVSYKLLKSELLGKHRMELISKQLIACEKLWSDLSIASKGKGYWLKKNNNGAIIYRNKMIELHNNIIDTVNSQHGLYYSRKLRKSIFELRDFMENEFDLDLKEEKIQISSTKANKIDGYVQNVRVAIRKELKLEDINAVKEGPL
jgi:hypothetical protein